MSINAQNALVDSDALHAWSCIRYMIRVVYTRYPYHILHVINNSNEAFVYVYTSSYEVDVYQSQVLESVYLTFVKR